MHIWYVIIHHEVIILLCWMSLAMKRVTETFKRYRISIFKNIEITKKKLFMIYAKNYAHIWSPPSFSVWCTYLLKNLPQNFMSSRNVLFGSSGTYEPLKIPHIYAWPIGFAWSFVANGVALFEEKRQKLFVYLILMVLIYVQSLFIFFAWHIEAES